MGGAEVPARLGQREGLEQPAVEQVAQLPGQLAGVAALDGGGAIAQVGAEALPDGRQPGLGLEGVVGLAERPVEGVDGAAQGGIVDVRTVNGAAGQALVEHVGGEVEDALAEPVDAGGMSELPALVAFALVGSITPGPYNALLLGSGIRFGFRRTARHVAGTAMGMGALVFAVAGGVGVVVLALPGAELALKLVGSAYLLYLALRIVGSSGVGGAVVPRPLGVLAAAAVWAAGGVALGRVASGGRIQQGINVALALVLAASVVLVWT